MAKNRIVYFDWLRVIATIGVVMLHSAAPILYEYKDLPQNQWWVGHVFDTLTRWCVPIFFMMSGALLLNPDKREPLQTFFKKRAIKVFIPFAAWSIFYLAIQIKTGKLDPSPAAAAKAVLEDKVYYHLWFMYVIIGLYVITPILKDFIGNTSRRNLELFIILWFVSTCVFSFVSKFYHIKIGMDAYPASGYIGYFIMGYYFFTYSFSRASKIFYYLVGLVGLVLTFAGTFFLTTENQGTFDGFFYHYLNVSTVFVSAAVFILFKDISANLKSNAGVMKWMDPINKASLGIYLVHPFIFILLAKFLGLDAFTFHPLVGIPIMTAVTIAISFVVVKVMQSIPVIRKVVPR
ncbi:acyltransferase family protein [Metabacillus sp. GX 13764]|uniref:acyltransferase n=1 Tax=Metabacillus kandeliae TaxID=2900151 RepID=UPI001E51B7B1|nr:acyltransferase family protein [Metabacillus kandeliae]MCD7034482.1 acyltransferase family protein [Metabacillus kandeliae]